MKIDTRLQESLVKAIVGKLFENGQGQQAMRLVLELPGKIDGGGWSKQSVADVIRRAFKDL